MRIFFLTILTSLAIIKAAYVPSEPWTTLTPTGTIDGATTDFEGSFALSLKTISSASTTGSVGGHKRDIVTQITDGQIQDHTTASISTLARTTASVVNQISDGQVQQKTSADIINQISDGQVQLQTQKTADVVNQIGDGQVQQTKTSATTASVANQISDGQVQAHTTASGVAQATDGQVQATGMSKSSSSDSKYPETCASPNSLSATLRGGILHDSKGRIGAIVANRQFQFDGPPPQAGSIYAAGWSISDGKLALGKQSTFYKCLSGTFYNLYDQSIGGQCSEVEIEVLKIVSC